MKGYYKVGIEESNISESVERMQDSIERVISPIVNVPIINGILVNDIFVSTNPSRIEHKLGRKPLGYFIVKRDANSVVFDLPEVREDLFLNLQASANVTVSLWVF